MWFSRLPFFFFFFLVHPPHGIALFFFVFLFSVCLHRIRLLGMEMGDGGYQLPRLKDGWGGWILFLEPMWNRVLRGETIQYVGAREEKTGEEDAEEEE